jgi:hypothetical protein
MEKELRTTTGYYLTELPPGEPLPLGDNPIAVNKHYYYYYYH